MFMARDGSEPAALAQLTADPVSSPLSLGGVRTSRAQPGARNANTANANDLESSRMLNLRRLAQIANVVPMCPSVWRRNNVLRRVQQLDAPGGSRQARVRW